MIKNIQRGFILTAVLLLVACGAGQEESISGEKGREATGEQKQYDVVEIENNERTITFTKVPERAVTLNQHVTEVMLALGLEDYMVGTAYLDDEIVPEYQEVYEQIPVLAEQYPSQEVMLSKEPDFVYAGWSSAYREDNVGTVEQLEEFGIDAYLHHSSSIIGPTIDDIYQDIRNIAAVFNVVERGEEIINQIQNELESIQARIPTTEESVRVFIFDSGEAAPLTVGQNFLNSIISMAGATNIFNDLDSNWGEVSWEEVVERDPEVIVIVDYGETTADEKKAQLLNHPALTDVTAIEQEHFITIPLSAAAEGIRVPLALELLVEGLYK